MTPSQRSAFAEGGGGGLFSASYLLDAIATIGVTAILIYVAWLVRTSYAEYGAGHLTPGEMLFVWVRGIFVLMVVLAIFI